MVFKRYRGLDGKLSEFTVFMIHGRSNDWEKVKKFIEDELNFKVRVIIRDVDADTIINQVRKAIWNCDCAIAMMSPDDTLIDNTKYARPNVLLEIGYTMGFFDNLYWEDDDLHPVMMLREKQVYIPSDLAGIKYIEYEQEKGIENQFPKIKMFLTDIFDKVKDYYQE